MFVLRRIAARAVFTQPARQLSAPRPARTRVSILRTEQASLCRSFHQSRQWLADEQRSAEQAEAGLAEAQSSSETVTTEPSAEEQKDIREESVASSEIKDSAQATPDGAIAQARQTTSSAAETVQNLASSAAETVSNAASAVFPPRNAPSGPRRSQNSPSRILYIGNLFFEVTAAQLEAEFSRFGRITNSRIVTDARGLSKGFAYVEFAEQSSADRAMQEMDQKTLAGRRMAVQYQVLRERRSPGPERLSSNPPSKTLFIGNMSYQMSDRDLNDLFREIRNVLDVRVAIDRRSGQPRGFAHADFIDVASAQRAKEHLEQKIVYGRQLRIDYSMSSAQTQNA